MEFGIFDHVDRSGVPLEQFYEERLQMAEAYDRLGFYAYHVAEHHFTPLGLASSPGVFLSAVAQRTKQLRFGPLVYTLPLYHPLRLAEEICMLDQMARGRFQVGVGRGISPIESGYYGEPADPTQSREVFGETLQVVLSALTQKRLSFHGKYRRADNVPIELDTLQKPHPPLWMGVHSLENAEFAARHGMNFVGVLPPPEMRMRINRYTEVARAASNGQVCASVKMGMSFFIVVADTDDEAQVVATRAYKVWHESFHYLYHLHGRAPVYGERTTDFREVQAEGRGVAGSPATVADFLRSRIVESGINYLVGQFVFGDMTKREALRCAELFGLYVMPKLRTAPATALMTA
jgi:alkanesulfonate monooxygenase SsuD/methylene tetrahydromethanopterin reductase-like flavin-dependent oxidoreductase (luciferase family)